jgi:integrase/recombinase XerD
MSTVIRIKTAKDLSCDMESAIAAFLSYSQSKNLSPRTIQYYREQLQSFTRFLSTKYADIPPAEITPHIIRELVCYEKDRTSPSTANHCLAVTSRFLGYLHSEGFIESNSARSVDKQKVRKPVIETFSPEQVERMLDQCRKDFYGVRDRAILLLLLDTGLRASELCGITMNDVNWTEQTILVTGKGDKERVVPFGQGVRQALNTYLSYRQDAESEALFVGHYGEPLDRFRLRDIVVRRCERAGIKGIRPSPHTLRHTAAVFYLRAGGDTFTLQRLLGHSSQEMTKRYCESLSAADVQKKHKEYSPVDNMNLRKPVSGRKRLR